MNRKYMFLFLLAAVLLALVLSPFASSWPDGLERVAEDKGFIEKGDVEPALHSPVPDYVLPGVKNEKVATALAGVLGTLLTFGVAYGLAALLRVRKGGSKQNAT
jgi:cobalt/nickel transport protein